MRKAAQILLAGLALGGGLPNYKTPASEVRKMKDRRPVTPPRSMTDEELEYYKVHKSLNGFKPNKQPQQ